MNWHSSHRLVIQNRLRRYAYILPQWQAFHIHSCETTCPKRSWNVRWKRKINNLGCYTLNKKWFLWGVSKVPIRLQCILRFYIVLCIRWLRSYRFMILSVIVISLNINDYACDIQQGAIIEMHHSVQSDSADRSVWIYFSNWFQDRARSFRPDNNYVVLHLFQNRKLEDQGAFRRSLLLRISNTSLWPLNHLGKTSYEAERKTL